MYISLVIHILYNVCMIIYVYIYHVLLCIVNQNVLSYYCNLVYHVHEMKRTACLFEWQINLL